MTVNLVQRAVSSARERGWRRSIETLLNHVEDRWFDLVNGTDTYARVEQAELHVDSPHQAEARPYYPTRGRALRKALRHFALPTDGRFVDLGSGKGKILLLAAGYGFRHATGVEFARELTDIAERNAARMRRRLAGATIENLCLDATAYRFRPDDRVIFMFAPFGKTVMHAVMANLRASLDEAPRRIHIVYTQADLLDTIIRHLPVREHARYVYGGHEFVLLRN